MSRRHLPPRPPPQRDDMFSRQTLFLAPVIERCFETCAHLASRCLAFVLPYTFRVTTVVSAAAGAAGISPGHRQGEDDVLHAPPPVRRDSGLPRTMDDLRGLHGLHGRREFSLNNIFSYQSCSMFCWCCWRCSNGCPTSPRIPERNSAVTRLFLE